MEIDAIQVIRKLTDQIGEMAYKIATLEAHIDVLTMEEKEAKNGIRREATEDES